MLGRVVVENGVKKIVPLTADCGSGNPVGTVIAVYSNKVPNGYLPCNGVQFDTAQFPVLYALLQDDHTPDLRECTLKGIGESGRTVGAHVKAGGLAVGEFIDDRVQNHKHSGIDWDGSSQVTSFSTGTQPLSGSGNMSTGRSGATTEVKAVGVNWCIKATSGINENQADNVLNILQPVDVVAVDNVHSVTSNAVAQKFLQHCFSTGIRISESFSVAHQEGSVWYDEDVWWRVFESTTNDANYNTMYAEITVINTRYQHNSPNVTKYIVSPNYRTSPNPSVIQLYKSGNSCHGIRMGRDSNNHWYIDLLLFANDYLIFAQGEGFKRCEKQAKVDMTDFTYVSTISN